MVTSPGRTDKAKVVVIEVQLLWCTRYLTLFEVHPRFFGKSAWSSSRIWFPVAKGLGGLIPAMALCCAVDAKMIP